jgi:hypothetical protein
MEHAQCNVNEREIFRRDVQHPTGRVAYTTGYIQTEKNKDPFSPPKSGKEGVHSLLWWVV